MNVLGLHTMGHDTGVCYFRDGQLVFAIEAERLTRCRHDHRVEIALHHFLDRTGVDPAEIDWIALSTNIRGGFARLPNLERANAAIGARNLHYVTSSEMLGSSRPCLVVAHEASHATLACHAAGFPDRCLALVNEGKGTFSRNSLFRLQGGVLSLEDADCLPWYGTGFGWSALGYAFGFGIGPGVAGKLMALGGHAEPSAEWLDLLLSLDTNLHHRDRAFQEREMERLVAGAPFNRDFAVMASAFATFQRLFGETVEEYLRRAMKRYETSELALGGGCALNVVLNSQLRSTIAPRLAVSPACNDAGQALGAAIYAMKFHLGIRPQPFSVYSNGLAAEPESTRATLYAAGLPTAPVDVAHVAAVLERGGVVGLMRGPSEIGPRALGNRSLLANPCSPGMHERVSRKLKGREWFRPLAPVMRQQRFAALFPRQPDSPHMLYAYQTPRSMAPAAVHVDGTARIQTLATEDNPLLDAVLEEFESRTGVPALINTSLNTQGRAIAHTTEDLLDDFRGREVELFLIGDWMAENRKPA